jgi:hypothetical protein
LWAVISLCSVDEGKDWRLARVGRETKKWFCVLSSMRYASALLRVDKIMAVMMAAI